MITKDDEARIEQAIAAAETRTCGEIVVVVARAASGYRLVPIVWAAFMAFLLPGLLLLLFTPSARRLYEIELLVFAILAFVLSFGRYRYRLVPDGMKRARAHEAAREQFLARGIGRTRERIGVMIYVAVAERYAEVVADTAVADRIDAAAWKAAIERLTDAVREGHAGDGLVAAVDESAAVLERHFPQHGEDRNELPNKVILL